MKKYSDEISQSISALSGVGVKTKSLLSEIGINSLFDLLSMPPIELIDKKENLKRNNLDIFNYIFFISPSFFFNLCFIFNFL